MAIVKHKNKLSQSHTIGLIILGLVGLAVITFMLLQGADVALFNPKGSIAAEQNRLIIFAVVLMLEVAIPTLIIFYFFAWKYREDNNRAKYEPNKSYSKLFIACLWIIPAVIVGSLVSIMWPATHELEPQKSIVYSNQTLTIQVIALRWKWLFIYPEQNIASVNYLQIPVDTPVQFELSADEAPMSSFWIPHLGGQLYAMTGHVNRLNLLADTAGDYPGRSAEINGAGFAGMKFIARASSKSDFDYWVQSVRISPSELSANEYLGLLLPSQNNSAALYSKVEADLFDKMLTKYAWSHGGHARYE